MLTNDGCTCLDTDWLSNSAKSRPDPCARHSDTSVKAMHVYQPRLVPIVFCPHDGGGDNEAADPGPKNLRQCCRVEMNKCVCAYWNGECDKHVVHVGTRLCHFHRSCCSLHAVKIVKRGYKFMTVDLVVR